MELKVPLPDIGSPTAINIYLEGGGGVVDDISVAYNYDTGEGRSITVDGNPSDWTGDTPDVIDTTGDATPSFVDATDFYTTDAGGQLYMRMDLAEPPSLSPWGEHPEEGSELDYNADIYIDRDNNPMTGYRYRSATIDIGADYKLHSHTYIMDWGQDYMLELYMWTGTDFLVYQPATWYLKSQLGSCLELSLRKSDIFVSPEPGQRIKIWIDWLIAINNDRVPNSGKFTATSTPIVSVGLLNFDDYRNRMGSVTPMYPSRTFYLPHFQQDAGWQTFYAIVNPLDTSTSITVTYYREDGSIISTDTSTLGAHCKLGRFAVAGAGWIKVNTIEHPIVGILNFDDYHNRMGSIVAATPQSSIVFPHFHQDANWQTFYAFVNLGPSATFTATYYRAAGSTITSTSTTVATNSKLGRFATSGTGWLHIV